MTENPVTSSEKDRPRLHGDVWASLLLVVLGIAFFSDFIFSSKNFYFRDIMSFHYPLRKVLIDAYARGEFPLWNPFIYFGQPMLANPNYMAFYPTNLLHLIFPFNYAFKLHFILHPMLAGLGLFFLQRRLGLSTFVSFAGALVYEFSGTVLSFLNLYNIIPAVALLPWIAWAFLRALEKNWLRRSLLLGVLLGLFGVAFEPLTFQCCLLILAALSTNLLLESRDRTRSALAILRVGAVGSALGFGLAGVQVLPTLEMIPHSIRGAGFEFEDLAHWSTHPMDLLNAVVPNLFGNYYTMGNATSWGESFHQGREAYLVSLFLGTGTLLLAALSAASRRKRLKWLFAGLAVIGVALALGRYDPAYHWLVMHIPLFRLGRYPSKYFLLVTLAVSLLCSLGLEALLQRQENARREKRRIVGTGIFGILIALVFLAFYVFWRAHPQHLEALIRMEIAPGLASSKNYPAILGGMLNSLLASGAFLLAVSTLVLVSRLKRTSVTLLGSLIVLLLGAELLPANLRLSPLISDADVDFVPEVNAHIERNGPKEPFRVFPPTSTLLQPLPDLKIWAPNRAAAWLTLFYRRSGQPFFGIMQGIQYSLDRSVDQLNTKDSQDMWEAFLQLYQGAALTLFRKLNTPMLLSLMDVNDPRVRLVSTFDTRSNVQLKLYWLKDVIARAYFVTGVERALSHHEAMRMFMRPDFPYENTVILEDPGPPVRALDISSGSARVLDYRSQRIVCEVQAQVPGYLVLLDSYYPGWHAYVDGREAKIARANFAFRAVAVDAGNHTVEFRFRPRSFYAGMALTCLSALAGIVVLIFA